jgi:hypothetical protein
MYRCDAVLRNLPAQERFKEDSQGRLEENGKASLHPASRHRGLGSLLRGRSHRHIPPGRRRTPIRHRSQRGIRRLLEGSNY